MAGITRREGTALRFIIAKISIKIAVRATKPTARRTVIFIVTLSLLNTLQNPDFSLGLQANPPTPDIQLVIDLIEKMAPQNEVLVHQGLLMVQEHPKAMPRFHPNQPFANRLPKKSRMCELPLYPKDPP